MSVIQVQPVSISSVIVTDESVINLSVPATQQVVFIDPGPVPVITANVPGPAGVSTWETMHTFAIGGTIQLAAGETNYLPPFFVSVPSTQVIVLKKARHKVHAGGPATVKLQRNGVDVPGYTGISVTTTKTETASNVTLADFDELALVVTNVSSTPQNLTFTLVLQHNM